MANNRTEKATPKRRRDSRRKGQIARSRELPAAAGFLGSVVALSFFGPSMQIQFQNLLAQMVKRSFGDAGTIPAARALLIEGAQACLWIAAPMLAAGMVGSLIANVGQGGIVLTAEPLKPKFKNLNPAENIKKIFSKNGLFELLKSLAKFLVVGYLVYGAISDSLPLVGRMSVMPLGETIRIFSTLVFRIAYRTGIFLFIIAAADYGFQRYRHEEQLKMTKQEVTDEMKETEGNPQVKGRIRSLQRALARRRMMAEVRKADVVITNPTHFAVALSYRREKMAAPVVVAKGADFLAKKIREIAREHQVTLIENPPLARALYNTTDIGQAIPSDLYQAVAEILAYVYNAKKTA